MDQASASSRRDIWVDLLLYPGHTLPTAAAPVIVAVGLAVHDHVFAALPAFLAFVASWLVHVGGVFTDNYELLTRHPDNREHPELVQAIENGTLTFSGLRKAIVVCYALAALAGPYLLYIAGIPVLVLALLGLVSSLIYSAGPFPFAKLGLADPLFFVMFGIVAVVGTYYVQAAPIHSSASSWLVVPEALPLSAFVIGLPVGALVTNVLLIDDMRDREFDAAKGWRTGPVRFGMGWSRAEYVGLSVFSFLIPFWFWLALGFSAWVLLPLLTLPSAISIARIVCTADRRESLVPMTPKAARLSLVYSTLLAIGVAQA